MVREDAVHHRSERDGQDKTQQAGEFSDNYNGVSPQILCQMVVLIARVQMAPACSRVELKRYLGFRLGVGGFWVSVTG